MKKVLIIQGSTRKDSFNKVLEEKIKEFLGDRVEIRDLDFKDDLPFMNQDLELDPPESVKRVRKEVMDADGIWIISPQYNHSYPAVVKNLIDWLSRPLDIEDKAKGTAIRGRLVTVSGIGGSSATKEMREKIAELLKLVGAKMVVEPVGANVNKEVWTGGELEISKEDLEKFREQAESFLEKI